MFKYQVLSDEEIDSQRKILLPGTYNFEVMDSTGGNSKSGNHMITLTLKIWDHEGKEHVLKDWLVSHPGMIFKIKHFWESVGKPEFYNGANEPWHFDSQSGKLEIRIQKNKEDGKEYPKVYDYIKKDPNDLEEDDLPF